MAHSPVPLSFFDAADSLDRLEAYVAGLLCLAEPLAADGGSLDADHLVAFLGTIHDGLTAMQPAFARAPAVVAKGYEDDARRMVHVALCVLVQELGSAIEQAPPTVPFDAWWLTTVRTARDRAALRWSNPMLTEELVKVVRTLAEASGVEVTP